MQLTYSDTHTTNMNGYCHENGAPAEMCTQENSKTNEDIVSNNSSVSKDQEHSEDDTFVFYPPLYIQRYSEVSKLLDEEKVTSVSYSNEQHF